jgi:Xaa-Pro dipeptidase
MDTEKAREFAVKLERIRRWMDEDGWDALVIGTQGNFSWISCGGRSGVLVTSEGADALVVLTRTAQYLVAYNMDGPRNLDEELGGLGFELVTTHWNEKSRETVVQELVKGLHTLSDIPLEGVTCDGQVFYKLQYPLTEWEVARYHEIGSQSERILRSVVDQVRPGMSELEVERRLRSAFALAGYISTVVLVGSDERVAKYRHPVPADKEIERYALIILCPRKYGLHVPITRSLCFGHSLDAPTLKKFEAASTIAAHCVARSRAGVRFAEVLEMQKRLYGQLGYPDGWRNHFQGGITGYLPNDSTLCLDPRATIQEKQTFNWFVTITGANTEDTCISGPQGGEFLTHSGAWPLKPYTVGGQDFDLPDILYLD